MITALLAALAGGVGAATRYGVEVALAGRLSHAWTRLMVINISGSILLGLLTGLAVERLLPADLQLILGSGLLGGYTTFSAASVATVTLLEERRWPVSLASSLGMLLGSAAAAALGLVVGLSLG